MKSNATNYCTSRREKWRSNWQQYPECVYTPMQQSVPARQMLRWTVTKNENDNKSSPWLATFDGQYLLSSRGRKTRKEPISANPTRLLLPIQSTETTPNWKRRVNSRNCLKAFYQKRAKGSEATMSAIRSTSEQAEEFQHQWATWPLGAIHG